LISVPIENALNGTAQLKTLRSKNDSQFVFDACALSTVWEEQGRWSFGCALNLYAQRKQHTSFNLFKRRFANFAQLFRQSGFVQRSQLMAQRDGLARQTALAGCDLNARRQIRLHHQHGTNSSLLRAASRI
jgi:hypothetical protein